MSDLFSEQTEIISTYSRAEALLTASYVKTEPRGKVSHRSVQALLERPAEGVVEEGGRAFAGALCSLGGDFD